MTYLLVMEDVDPAKRQKNEDRFTGYVILSVLFLLFTALGGYGVFLAGNPGELRTVAFNQIGNLRIDDPVNAKGISAGTITRIEWRPRNVLVFFRTPKPLTFHRGYSIDDVDVGLMGDRMLVVDFGDTTAPVIPAGDTLVGTFHNGVSEAVGLAGKLHDQIDSFANVSFRLLQGTPGHPSIVQQVNKIVSGADSASIELTRFIESVNGVFSVQLDSIDRIVGSAMEFSQTIARTAPGYLTELDAQMRALALTMKTLDETSDRLISLISSLKNLAPIAGDSHITSLSEKISTLHGAIVHLKERLLRFKVYLSLF